MKTFKLHLIRHGMTAGNLQGLYIGSGSAAQTDFALEFHDEVSSFLFLVYYLL